MVDYAVYPSSSTLEYNRVRLPRSPAPPGLARVCSSRTIIQLMVGERLKSFRDRSQPWDVESALLSEQSELVDARP